MSRRLLRGRSLDAGGAARIRLQSNRRIRRRVGNGNSKLRQIHILRSGHPSYVLENGKVLVTFRQVIRLEI